MESNPLWIFQAFGWLHPMIVCFPIGLLFLGLFTIRGRQESFFDDLLYASTKNAEEKDVSLWNNFKTGCIKSYELIYRENVQNLFNYGMTILPNEAQVKDCIQELFFEIWKGRKNLTPTNNIRFYLLKSLRYKVQHAKAKEEKMKNIALKSYADQGMIFFPFEDESINGQDIHAIRKKVKTALNKLTSRQKEVITLIFFEGMTYEEVANIMSISVGSIYTLAWKAISRLKKAVI